MKLCRPGQCSRRPRINNKSFDFLNSQLVSQEPIKSDGLLSQSIKPPSNKPKIDERGCEKPPLCVYGSR